MSPEAGTLLTAYRVAVERFHRSCRGGTCSPYSKVESTKKLRAARAALVKYIEELESRSAQLENLEAGEDL